MNEGMSAAQLESWLDETLPVYRLVGCSGEGPLHPEYRPGAVVDIVVTDREVELRPLNVSRPSMYVDEGLADGGIDRAAFRAFMRTVWGRLWALLYQQGYAGGFDLDHLPRWTG